MHRFLLAAVTLLVAAVLALPIDPGRTPSVAAQAPLTITLITPTFSPATGGAAVTILGTGFDTAAGGTQFTNAGSSPLFKDVVCVSTTQCTATALPNPVPQRAAFTSPVFVTVNGVRSSTHIEFIWYGLPGLVRLSPASGPAHGGTLVTLSGGIFPSVAPFGGSVSIRFGDKQAIRAACPTVLECWVRAPAGSGTVHVTITTPGGTSNGLPFTYISGAPSPTAPTTRAQPRCTPWSWPFGLIVPWQNCTG